MKLSNCNFLLLVFVLFVGCSAKSQDEKLNVISKELKNVYNVDIKDDVKQVIFINDNTCPNCVESFSNFILNDIDKYKDSSLIIINSLGQNVDLDRFNRMGLKNIVISQKSIEQNGYIPDLGVVYINKNKVDTIISVEAEGFIDQLKYIDKRN